MRVVILAGGEQSRWTAGSAVQFSDGVRRVESRHPCKLLAPVGGLPLLERTLAQLRQRGREATLHAHEPALLALAPDSGGAPVADVVGAVQRVCEQGEDTLVLLGDVCFSAEAMDRVLAPSADPWRLYGKLGGNAHTGKAWPEIYALRIQGDGLREVSAAVARLPAGLARRKLWELYRALRGEIAPRGLESDEAYLLHPPADPRFEVVDDWTDDIDLPIEHHVLKQVMQRIPGAGRL